MRSGKNHFEATMVFNDETIRLMFRTEYYAYERMQLLTRLAIALVLLFLAVLTALPAAAKVLCLLVGSWLFVARDFPSRIQAERVLSQRGGAESTVKCRLNENGIDVENGVHIGYGQVDRLVLDDTYYYIFQDRQSAIMFPKASLIPGSPERFERFTAKMTGREWKRSRGPLALNRKDLRQMIKDKALRWVGR